MKFNNLDDEYLDNLNEISQKIEDINSNYLKIIPRATNESFSTTFLYYQRKNYEKYLNNRFEYYNVNSDSFKDFIYKHNLYGKVDLNNNSVTIINNSLKVLTIGTNFSLANVAADAFEEMMSKYQRIINSGLILKNSNYYNLTVKKAYSSPHIEYNVYLNTIMNDFINYIQTQKLKNKIIDYKSTINCFINYYNDNFKNIVINKSEFIKSNICSPNISGLVVEFSKDDHGNDLNKYNKYTEDDSYIAFQNLAKEFGFTLDRHAPWRIVFDLESPPAVRYLTNNYQISSTQNYFNTNYYLADYFDYESFKINMYNLYAFIASNEPEFKIAKFKSKNDKLCINQKLIRRNLFKYYDLNLHIDENYLLKAFFYIKCKENNIIFSIAEFEQHFDEISKILRYKDLVSALDLIMEKCKLGKNKGDENFIVGFV